MWLTSCSNSPWKALRKIQRPLLVLTIIGVATGFSVKWHFEHIWTVFYELIKDLWGSALGMEARISILGFILFFTLYFFGMKREKLLLVRIATLGLFLTTLVSATVIVALNSWMQYPSGIRLMNNPMGYTIESEGLLKMFFSPTFPVRYTHVLIGAGLFGGSWVLWRTQNKKPLGLALLLLLWIGQFAAGHFSAKVSYQFQPEKFAVFEGHDGVYESADLWLFPNQSAATAPKLKGMISYLLFQDSEHPLYGTAAWKQHYLTDMKNWTFKSYHFMVLGQFLMLALLVLAFIKIQWNWGAPYATLLAGFFFVALLSNFFGWYTAELGRQPWMIRGVITVHDSMGQITSATAWKGLTWTLITLFVPLAGSFGQRVWVNKRK